MWKGKRYLKAQRKAAIGSKKGIGETARLVLMRNQAGAGVPLPAPTPSNSSKGICIIKDKGLKKKRKKYTGWTSHTVRLYIQVPKSYRAPTSQCRKPNINFLSQINHKSVNLINKLSYGVFHCVCVWLGFDTIGVKLPGGILDEED